MRARGKESVKVASFARSSMTVSAVSASESVCIGSPRARRPLVVWLRFAASRLGRSRGAVYLLSMLLSHRLSRQTVRPPRSWALGWCSSGGRSPRRETGDGRDGNADGGASSDSGSD